MVKVLNKGRIVKIISNSYTVLSGNEKFECRIRGKFRNLQITPMVGDIVYFTDNMIEKIETRKNELERPFVSNVDQAVIVISVKEPALLLNLLDKLLIIIEFNHIKPIICFTKLDLLDDLKEIKTIMKYYQTVGYLVFTNQNTDLKKVFKNKLTVFTGQTGAGKSTLLNKLGDLKIDTSEISKALGRGKHTTRHVELYELFGGLVADTPGFSALYFKNMTASDIRDSVIEFNEYKDKCRYRDCLHQHEDGCYIKELVKNNHILASRYQNYLKFINEV